jgi:hypothetical protein
MNIAAWTRIGFDAWLLGFEAASVIGLRTMKLAAGGTAAACEADLMMREKVEAAGQLQWQATTGQLGTTPTRAARKAVAHYRRKVRANRRRLSR